MQRPCVAVAAWVDETGSTMDLAAQWLRDGGATPYWIAARRQTAGRGQHGRRWWGGEGALLTSAAIRLADYGIPHTPEMVGRVPLLAGLAALRAVRPWIPGADADVGADFRADADGNGESCGGSPWRLGLKWPNDLHCGGRKLAGILVESPKPGELVIGIGINVNNSIRLAPPEIRERIAAICDFGGGEVPLETLLDLLARDMDTSLRQFAADPGCMIRRARTHCLLTGRRVRIGRPVPAENSAGNSPPEIADADLLCAGVCRGIADDGRLIVESADGESHFFTSATVRILEEDRR